MAIATNTLPVSSLLAKSALSVLRNKFILTPRTTTSMQEIFKSKNFKAGDTVSIKLPPRYVSALGAAIQKNNTTQTTTSLTVVQRNIGLGFLTKDLTLSLDGLRAFVEPVMAQLASDIDGDGFALYYKATNLATPGALVTAGTGLAPAQWTGAAPTFKAFLDARARLVENGMSDDGQAYAALAPATSAEVVDALKGLFEAREEIANQYKRGLMRVAAGFQWLESQQVPRHVNGTRTTGVTVTGGGQTGSSLLVGGAGNALTVNRGDQFTLAGVYSINPSTRVASNRLQVFTVQTATASDAGGVATLSIAPSLNVTSPNQTVSALPSGGAVLTWMGAASAATDANLTWHRDAIYSAFLPLEDDLPGADVAMETDSESGITVRVVGQYAAETDELVWRADVLYGFQVVRPSLMARVQG